MRVLITSTPGSGHVHPLVPIASALQRAGHVVTWATASESCGRVEQFGFAALPAGMDTAQRLAAFAERCPQAASAPPRQQRSYAYPFMWGAVAAPRMFDDLGGVFDAVHPDVVVHEPSELGAAPAAAGRGIPNVAVGFGDLIPDALMVAAAPEVAALWSAAGVEMSLSCGLYDHLYLHPFPPALSRPTGGLPVRAMRPIAFDGRVDDLPPSWTRALGSDRPCLYVTFGTEFAHLAPFAALTAALDRLPADVVLTVGPRVDASSIGPVPVNVRVERFVPQSFVLAKSTAIISHAGSGAVLGAARMGLPQLCLPMAADQFDNADAVSGSGAGFSLEPKDVDADALRRGIERLLADARLRERAARIVAEIDAMPPPDELVVAIEALAR